MSDYRKSDYLAVPAVWGDEREGYATRTVPAEHVEPGNLVVFENDHGNAYKVVSVDRVVGDFLDGDGNDRTELLRFNCSGGATAGTFQGRSVTLLVPDPRPFCITDPVISERQWRHAFPISEEYLCSSIDFAQLRGLPVHAWTGEDRDGKPLAVVWVAGKKAGQLFSAFEIAGR